MTHDDEQVVAQLREDINLVCRMLYPVLTAVDHGDPEFLLMPDTIIAVPADSDTTYLRSLVRGLAFIAVTTMSVDELEQLALAAELISSAFLLNEGS